MKQRTMTSVALIAMILVAMAGFPPISVFAQKVSQPSSEANLLPGAGEPVTVKPTAPRPEGATTGHNAFYRRD